VAGIALGQVAPQESLDLERFKPAITYDGFVVTEGTAVRGSFPHDPIQLGLLMNGSLNPLVVVSGDGEVANHFVSRRAGGDLLASLTIAGPLALGVSLPFFVAQAGDFDPAPSGIGDVRIAPKLRLLDDRRAPLGLAVLTELRLPTHSDDEFSGGARSAIFAPRLAIDHRFPFGLRLGGNAGVLLREATTFGNVEAASEFVYSAAAAVRGQGAPVGVGAEVHGGAGLTSLDFEELPLEGELYLSVFPRPDIEILGGPGMGLVPGYGTPTFRFFLGVRFAPTAHDRDYDGIADDDDRCADDPEDRNGREDLDGCPDGDDAAKPGTVVVTILGPDREPLKKGEARVDDDKGAPGPDPGTVVVSVDPGDHVLWVHAKGYVPQRIEIEVSEGKTVAKTVALQKIDIEVTEDSLQLGGTVYFDVGSARIVPESHDLLDEVALVLQETPSIRKMRIEGHTDSRGSAEMNQKLSEDRAAAVVAYLVAQGVQPGRLEAQGYGETRPISEVLDENRRVEFVIVRGNVGE
jgi:outer membrane protein OmpA-like peptidoglycan-associated protein